MQSNLQKATDIGPTPIQPEDLHSPVALVTGGAMGIGFEVSRALANAGCRVIMVSHKEEQDDEAIAKIRKESPRASIEWKECDMGNLAHVRDVFSTLCAQLYRLGFLVLSAGINTNEHGLDAEGIDRHFGVNYLGQYYVCNQLWPVLKQFELYSTDSGEVGHIYGHIYGPRIPDPMDIHYEFSHTGRVPPFPERFMMHRFKTLHSCDHASTTLWHHIPKRKGTPPSQSPPDLGTVFGLYLKEGFDCERVLFCTAVLFLVAVAFGSAWACLYSTRDAFAIGVWIMGLWTIRLATVQVFNESA
ncbi:hypothetical protein B0T17DRAFT_625198 [Bombardia bombarda]|uniref:Uncharacterized protein n=1 Tax=Bombardia bombarda TaxID=252184 RepID=A0AA40CFV8_9PEZI|nr:hypothetical protein B0T17DRAFT_625198 [Bombardia bombarda]